MRKFCMGIGIAAVIISGVFTVRFFYGFGNSGFERIFYGGIGAFFQMAQAVSVVVGTDFRKVGKNNLSYLAFGVFFMLCSVSVIATIGSFSADHSQRMVSRFRNDPEVARIRSEIKFYTDERVKINARLDEGTRKLLIKKVVDPAIRDLRKNEETIAGLRGELANQKPDEDILFIHWAGFFGNGMSADQVRVWVWLLFAIMIELVGTASLCAGTVYFHAEVQTVSNQMVMSRSKLQWWAEGGTDAREVVSNQEVEGSPLFDYIKKKERPTRGQIQASRVLANTEEYDREITRLIALGLVRVDTTPRRKSDYVYSLT